jgi:X-Pro dipeptidyl-peptidase
VARRFQLVAIALCAALLGPAAALAEDGGAAPPPQTEAGALPDLDVVDPIVHDYDDAIVERHLVTARDGLTPIAVDLIRPDTDEPVPAIFFSSPYYNGPGRGYQGERKTPWTEGPAFNPAQPWTLFPEWYDEHFVPRGYAVVMADMRGTRNSGGCQVYGGREEITDAVDVIEWIAEQPWSNGAVGMSGGSYDGTVATGAASMAPEPLKAVIPIRAIDRWYDYHFFNGLQSAQHLLTPWSFTVLSPLTDVHNSREDDPLWGPRVVERRLCAATVGALTSALYSVPYQDATARFWADRDYLVDAESITAATFIIHGLDDTNVKTTNAGHLWEALPEGTPRKLWWLRGAHDDPANPDLPFPVAEQFVELTHRWFAQFLKGIDAGALDVPEVLVQREDGTVVGEDVWPAEGSDLVLHLTPDGLSEEPAEGSLAYGDGGLSTAPSTLLLDSEPLAEDLRISGQAMLRLRYALALGGDTTFAYRLDRVSPDGTAREIAAAYARGAYRDEIAERGPSWPTLPRPHLPGAASEIAFPFVHHDTVVPAGDRLRLRVTANDGRVQGGGTGGTVTLELGGASTLVLPVAGG